MVMFQRTRFRFDKGQLSAEICRGAKTEGLDLISFEKDCCENGCDQSLAKRRFHHKMFRQKKKSILHLLSPSQEYTYPPVTSHSHDQPNISSQKPMLYHPINAYTHQPSLSSQTIWYQVVSNRHSVMRISSVFL